MLNYINNETIYKMNNIIKQNMDQLVSFKGTLTEGTVNLFSNIPSNFRLPIVAVDAAIADNRDSLMWTILDSVFYGVVFTAGGIVLSALNFVAGTVLAPIALVVDGIPSLFSKQYRNEVKLARKIKKLNKMLKKCHGNEMDYAIQRKHKVFANFLQRLNPITQDKVEKLINEIEGLNKQLGREVVEEKTVTVTNFVSDKKTPLTSNIILNQNTNQHTQETDRSL